MIYKILVAHESHPNDFKHEMNIELVNRKDFCDDLINEIVDLLNENRVRDCIFKWEDE